jgi:hypothetical protein
VILNFCKALFFCKDKKEASIYSYDDYKLSEKESSDVDLMVSFMINDKLCTFFCRYMKDPAFKNGLMLVTELALNTIHGRKRSMLVTVLALEVRSMLLQRNYSKRGRQLSLL